MSVLFWDTETGGLPLWREPSDDIRQPHLCSLAAVLCDDDGRERCSFHFIVHQDGWECEPQALATHGITREISEQYGLPEIQVLSEFLALVKRADLVVAHNESFDRRIGRIAFKRHMGEFAADWWEKVPGFCTMKAATQLCQLPPTERQIAAGFGNGFKNPKLEEALKILCGEDLDGAHDAWADAQGCRRLWLELKRRGAA